jgi:AsmA protein
MVASEALGMEVHVGGRLGITFFPNLHVRLDDVHIRNGGMDVAAAQEASLEIALLPLLQKEVRIRRIGLQRPRISIKRDRDGKFNFEQREKAKRTFPASVLDNLFLTDVSFLI